MRAYASFSALVGASVVAACVLTADASAARASGDDLRTPDPTGVLSTVAVHGDVLETGNPFFNSLGTNGRACVSCHVPDQAWSISPQDVQRRFDQTGGTDPIFRTNDGSNSPTANVSSVGARRAAYSMLLTKGLIRVGMRMPAASEFDLAAVDDPYGHASADDLSLFRRPLPSTNLGFLNTVMWDGRETVNKIVKGGSAADNLAALRFDLGHQANDATLGHAQASQGLTTDEREQIVNFEMGLFTAQVVDTRVGNLASRDALGGPRPLIDQPFFVGINDLTVNATTSPPTVVPPSPGMTLFTSWLTAHDPPRLSVARGQAIFNTRPITITGVAGLNDATGLPVMQGTCTTCHNTPNVGNHSVSAPLNIGISDAARRTPDLPLYTLRNLATGATVQTTDPGRALITGSWADIGKFKGPILRGLAARAPYFHNGSAATLDAVVDFYNTRFGLGLNAQEHADLVAFLRSL